MSIGAYFLLFLGLTLIFLISLRLYEKRRTARLLVLWNKYQEALKAGDKYLALEKGREFFYQLRHKKLTDEDEEIIRNDIRSIAPDYSANHQFQMFRSRRIQNLN